MGAGKPPTVTHAPANCVGRLPFTRSSGPATRAVPAAAKLTPKTVAMALSERFVTAGALSPALTTPPGLITGAVGEIAAAEVTLKTTEAKPIAEAVTVNGPMVVPSVTPMLAVPSPTLTASGFDSVAAFAGDTVN